MFDSGGGGGPGVGSKSGFLNESENVWSLAYLHTGVRGNLEGECQTLGLRCFVMLDKMGLLSIDIEA